MTCEDKLIKRMEQGDTGAADELIGMFYPEILRYCLWHAPNRSLAEDAAQETFLKFIRYFDRYAHKGIQIVNIRNEDREQISVRYLAEQPDIMDSKPVSPHLEDLYLWLFPQERIGRR